MTKLFAWISIFYLALFSANIVNGDKLYPVNIGGKYGFIDCKGELKIKPKYDIAKTMNEGLAYVELGSRKGYINNNGKWNIIFETKRESISFDQFINDNSEDGDKQEMKAINYCYPFSEGYAVISSPKKYGFCNKSGKIVIPLRFTNAKSFSEGCAGVEIETKENKYYGFIGTKGQWVIKPKYDFVLDFSNGLSAVKKDGRWGFINKKGGLIIENKYKATKSFSEGLAPVCVKDTWGCINKNDKVVIPFKFKSINSFSEGLAIASSDSDKYGYIDKDGEYVISPQYENCLDFTEGLACVSKDNKWGYIDKKGTFIVKPQYINCYSFDGGIARVIITGCKYSISGAYGYINKTGKFIFKGNGKKEGEGGEVDD